jgi:hypothetical protein
MLFRNLKREGGKNHMRKALVVAVAVLASAGMASALTLEVVSRTIDAAPGQEVLIVASGPGQIGGMNLNVQVGDGGDVNDPPGTDVAGVTVAGMETISFRANGAIWGADAATFEEPGLLSPPPALVSFGGFVLQAGNKQLGDTAVVVATIILDATGVDGAKFPISLAPYGAPSDFAGQAADLVSGMVEVVPEPATALLLLAFAPLLRRRR